MDKKILDTILLAQRNEITEYHIYLGLAEKTKDVSNRQVLETIAKDEMRHYEFWRRLTGRDVAPDKFMVWRYIFVSRMLGLSFGLKLMEKGEVVASHVYETLRDKFPEASVMVQDEQKHEKELLDVLEEERVEYAGSMVLGLNDALVELTGALTGLTFALQNGKIIAITGLITGIAASMSMAASSYLSSKEESHQNKEKNPVKSALYTGVAYILTVSLLVLPYFLLENLYIALATMLATSIFIVFAYTFYITTAKNLDFWRRFGEMAILSFSVAAISFVVGNVLRHLVGVDI